MADNIKINRELLFFGKANPIIMNKRSQNRLDLMTSLQSPLYLIDLHSLYIDVNKRKNTAKETNIISYSTIQLL